MGKAKPRFICAECAAESSKWVGQCPDCAAWNSMTETSVRTARGVAARGSPTVIELGSVDTGEQTRDPTGLAELDRVLGGGLVPGSVVLLGGDPGIGKSTLLMQTVASVSNDRPGPLYVTGEESLSQIALRARRMGLDSSRVNLVSETHAEAVVELVERMRPSVVVIDSIQTMYSDSIQSAPGSVSQVRESAARLVRCAKDKGITTILVGHVTKDGALAGPRVLEHMVDTVLYFESEADRRFRVIRSVKNRFGAANEIGLFAMTERGLREVRNPSAIFLSRGSGVSAGSVVTVVREGTRPLLIELQSLVDDAAAGPARRVTVGLDAARLNMLLAVLHRHASISTQGMDVYANVVGGVRITETSADLALLAAVRSSLSDRPVDRALIVFGEVGLSGEVRPVPNGEERLGEAAKHGFRRAVIPRANVPRQPIADLEVVGVETVDEALRAL